MAIILDYIAFKEFVLDFKNKRDTKIENMNDMDFDNELFTSIFDEIMNDNSFDFDDDSNIECDNDWCLN